MRVNELFMKLNKFKEKISYFFKSLFFSFFYIKKQVKILSKKNIKKKKTNTFLNAIDHSHIAGH